MNEEIVTLDRLLTAMRTVDVFSTENGVREPYLEAMGRKLVKDFCTKWPWIPLVDGAALSITSYEPALGTHRDLVMQYGNLHPTIAEFVAWFNDDDYWMHRGCPDGRTRFLTNLGYEEPYEEEDGYDMEDDSPKPVHALIVATYVADPGATHEMREQLLGAERQLVTAGGMDISPDRHHVRRGVPGTEWSELIVEVTDPLQFYQNICIAAMRNLIVWGSGNAFRVQSVQFPVTP